jgi:trehalose 6-phosphate phosphatase
MHSNPQDHRGESRDAPPPIDDDCALFLDVDGSLLDFADDPASVRADPRLRAALDALASRLQGALALVSGRTLSALDAIFAPARYPARGVHGLERRDAPRSSGDHVALHAIAGAARHALAPYPGALVETKGHAALALHWRAAPAAEAAARAFAEDALARLPGYRLEPGNQVLELRADGVDKGSAIRDYMREAPFAGRVPVFAGDDLGDEAGFVAVNAMGGRSVLVGARGDSAARYALADPAAVLRWLEKRP